MSSFSLPGSEPISEQEKWQDALRLSLRNVDFAPKPFEQVNVREAENEIRYAVDENIGFFGKFYNALAEETVTGQLISDLGDPSFPDTNYYPSDEDKGKFGKGLDPEVVNRIANETNSLEEFLYELDNARLTQKRREELYSGGASGFATGLALTMVASGGEAAVLAALISAATAGAGAPSAVASTTTNLANTAARATRARAILKAAGSSLALDVPLEGIRYATDKTMTTTDLLIGLGASVTMGAGFGALFPESFVGPLRELVDTAKIQQAADAAAKAGDTATADALNNLVKSRIRVRRFVGDDPTEEVMEMDLATLRKEAKKYGIDISERFFETTTVVDPVTGKSVEAVVRRVPNRVKDIEEALTQQDEPIKYSLKRMSNPEATPRARETKPVPQDMQVPGLYERRVRGKAKKEADEELTKLAKQLDDDEPPLEVDTAGLRTDGVKKLLEGDSEADFDQVKILNVMRRVEKDPEVVVEVIDELKRTGNDPFLPLKQERISNDREIRLELLSEYYEEAKKLVGKRRDYRARRKALVGDEAKKQLEKEYTEKLAKARSKADKEMLRRDYNRRIKAAEKIQADLDRAFGKGVNLSSPASGVPLPGPKGSSGATTAGPNLVPRQTRPIKYTKVSKTRFVDEQKLRDLVIARKMLERIGRQTKANKAVKAQVERKWAQLGRQNNGDAARRRYARVLGVSPKIIAGPADILKRATISAAIKAAKRGYAVIGEVGKPKGIKFSTGLVLKGVRYGLAGNAEQMLWKLATTKGKNAKEVRTKIISYLKERGVENPEKLSKDFAKKVKDDINKLPESKRSTYVADLSEMELESARRVRKDGSVFVPNRGDSLFGERRNIDFKVDADLLGEKPSLKSGSPEETEYKGSNLKKDDPDIDPDDVDDLTQKNPEDVEESIVTDDKNNPVAVGDSDDAEAVDIFMRTPQKYDTPARGGTLAANGDRGSGFRDWIARKVDRMGKVPGLSLIPYVGNFFFNAFTPVVYRFLNSASDKVRLAAAIFFDDPRGHGQSSVMAIARLNFERVTQELSQKLAVAGEAARKQGRKLLDRDLIRMVRSGKDFDGPEGIAVAALRDFFKKLKKFAADEGLPVDEIPDDPSYFARSWNPAKFRAKVEQLGGGKKGRDKITNFLAEAIKRKNEKLTEKQAIAVSKRIVEYLNNPEAKRHLNNSVTTLDKLKTQLVEELGDIQDDALSEAGGIVGLADDLINIIGRNHTDSPNLSFGRRRIKLDELFEQTIDGVQVNLDDLLDMDISLLTRRYAHQSIGAVAARKGIAQLFDGDASKTIVDVKALIRESAQDAGDSDAEIAMFERMLEVGYKTITGQQVYNKTVMKIAQANNMFAQATLGMTMGFAQIPEIANIVFRSGFRAAWQQLNLRDVVSTFGMGFKRNRLRSEVDELSACLEAFTGIGGDFSRGDHFMRRMDDIGFDDTEFVNTKIGKVLDAGRLVSVLNPLGVMPMDTMMRRWASRASFQHFMNTAYSVGKDGRIALKKSWWRNSKERFAQLGMNEDDVNRIAKILKNTDYVKYERGMFGSYIVKSFDFSKVDDQGIVDKFVMALRRSTDSMVQRQTFSEMPAWMNTEVGKLFSQFRVFAIVAKSKQLAAGLARGDAYELGNVVGGAGLATLGYLMQTYYRSLGQEDPEEYWNEKTGDTDKLIRSAIMRSGYSTIFPALIDLAAKQTTGEGVFDSSGRTTGQAVDFFEGATIASNYNKIKDVLNATMGAVFRDKELTQRDWQHLQGLVWLAKIPALDQLINKQLISNAPESNR